MLWWTEHISTKVDRNKGWDVCTKGWDVNSKGWDVNNHVWVEMCALF